MLRLTIPIATSGEPNEHEDLRVLRALRAEAPSLKDLSRAQLKRWLKDGVVQVRRKGSELVIEYQGALETAQESVAEVYVPILYEDSELLVLNKPEGIPSAPVRPMESGTALAAALSHAPMISQVPGLSEREPGLLHRLDTRTSGCLALAKTPESFARLREAWKAGHVRKTYRAVVRLADPSAYDRIERVSYGRELLIDAPLAHDSKSKKRMIALTRGTHDDYRQERQMRGKPLAARTWIRGARELSAGRWDLTVEIETGVMHQIRCHLASIGLPIEGDRIYGNAPQAASRMMLHSWKLEIPTARGARILVESTLPWI